MGYRYLKYLNCNRHEMENQGWKRVQNRHKSNNECICINNDIQQSIHNCLSIKGVK